MPDHLSAELLGTLAAHYRGRDDPQAMLEFVAEALLVAIGEDPEREGLVQTPARFARSWLEFLAVPTANLDTTFEVVQADQLIVLQGHRVWSKCEHHLLPFWCDLTIGYIPHGRVLGVSKLARIANFQAHKLQIQERLVHEIADELGLLTGHDNAPNPDVAVLGRGHHLCMMMRGVQSDAPFVTSALFGAFREQPELRAEFFALATAHD